MIRANQKFPLENMATVLHSSPKPPQLTHFFPSRSNFLAPLPPIPNPSLQHHHLYNFKSSTSKIFFSSSFSQGSNTPPETVCPVPLDQQPINEYQTLSTSFPFSWASSDVVEYSSKLFVTGASFALFVGFPVAWFGSVGPETEPFKRIMCSVSSGVLIVTLAVVRMYLGWAYVGNRLLSATVECKWSLLTICAKYFHFNSLVAKKLRRTKELECQNR